ncbi:MAG: phosphodiesterase YaeI [Verrucomicrobiota bacterium]|nr:phosphodiesterase YaeI [Verrucomicrobiota bacterium]
MKPSRKFLTRRNFLVALGLGGVGSIADAHWVEPHWLGVGRHEIKFAKSRKQSPLKILQLSDFHLSPAVDLSFIKESIELGIALKPDLICLTGDFITAGCNPVDRYIQTLSLLSQCAPTFACLGNHDGGRWAGAHRGFKDTEFIQSLLKKAGVVLLHNTMQTVRVRDWNLTLVGLGDAWAEEMLPEIAFAPLPASRGDVTIVLSHNPDTKTQLQPYEWDLMLCGHTHGGQVRLPLIGTPFAPVRDKNFVEGLHYWNSRWIHITRGVGNLHGVRFNCRPEVSLLTLTSPL